MNEMTGGENAITICRRIFEAYLQNPTKALRSELKIAYEAIPSHQRIYVGTMDTKDYEVRQVIYGDDAKKDWANRYGMEYPFADMPKPVDE